MTEPLLTCASGDIACGVRRSDGGGQRGDVGPLDVGEAYGPEWVTPQLVNGPPLVVIPVWMAERVASAIERGTFRQPADSFATPPNSHLENPFATYAIAERLAGTPLASLPSMACSATTR
jgi:hypothetical protein